jgi:mono/diheme cytochrome c family protein
VSSRRLFVILVIALAAAACSGRAAGGGGDTGGRNAPDGLPLAAEGVAVYEGSCLACHAEGGVGVEGLGRPLTNSDFVRGLTDAELVTFIQVGRDSSDPANTSGIAMPANGGNPALTRADLEAVVAYLRTLN